MIWRYFVFSAMLLLSACGGGEHVEIRQWMEEASRNLHKGIPPLPELKPFPIIAYEAGSEPDPFGPGRLEPERLVATGKFAPDFNRPREQLENFPLESISFIGLVTKNKNKERYALVKVQGVIYQVTKGNYMGLDFGRVVDITENEIILKERVQDPTGQTSDWVEREAVLQLVADAEAKGGSK
ncbi:MAG: pilus assembly protein PilP [Rhodocyclaceae bacterium]|nr:pilus assembly protein PilP [Rhodocyclaceae bacterium]